MFPTNCRSHPLAGFMVSVVCLTLSLPCGARAQSTPTVPSVAPVQPTPAAPSTPETAESTLKWSMAKYADLTTFQADCAWTETIDGSRMHATRSIRYEKPNRFKIVSLLGDGAMTQTSVSDGKTQIECGTGVDIPAMSYSAPGSLATATSMFLNHPMFCGTLLYQFFGGSDRYAHLVDMSKMPVTFGPPVTVNGHDCKSVRFWASGLYGKTEIAIGAADGLVYRIRYGSEPLIEQMHGQLGKNKTLITTEEYTNVAVGAAIDPAVFTAKAPAGQKVQSLDASGTPKPPVPLGNSAPDFHVTGLNGTVRHLSDFRGKVVQIDFWATWCGPCRKGLPETQRFYTEFGNKGLAVLTISDEERATVSAFTQKSKFSFPVYLDTNGSAEKSYGIQAIPTTVVIDRTGRLIAYIVGLVPRAEIVAALKKAGLTTAQ